MKKALYKKDLSGEIEKLKYLAKKYKKRKDMGRSLIFPLFFS